MSKKVFFEALINVWKIKKSVGRDTGIDQAIKFALTGGLGTITNLALFFICADIANLPAVPISVGCFIIAGTQNYFIHHNWSFAENTKGTKPTIKQWALFLVSSLAGLAVNIGVMNLMLQNLSLPFKVLAQAAGILSGMVINFIATKFFVFRRSKNANQ
jgi:putative flippase GtrA